MKSVEAQTIPSVLCRPFLVEFDALEDRFRAFGGDAQQAVAELSPEPLPSHERIAQQHFLECLDAMSWQGQTDAQAGARALFDRLFWTWRSDDLRIVEIDRPPFGLDVAWSPDTAALFAQVWNELAPVIPELKKPFTVALENGELVGSFEEFTRYASAWGRILTRAMNEKLGLIVVQFSADNR